MKPCPFPQPKPSEVVAPADGTRTIVPSAPRDATAGAPRVSAGTAPSPKPPVPADFLEVVMPDDVALFLRLSAEHQGVSRAEIVLRAIPHFAATVVGLPGLADFNRGGSRAADFNRGGSRAADFNRGGSRAAAARPTFGFNEEGELTEVPTFARVRLSRFASVADSEHAPP